MLCRLWQQQQPPFCGRVSRYGPTDTTAHATRPTWWRVLMWEVLVFSLVRSLALNELGSSESDFAVHAAQGLFPLNPRGAGPRE